MFVETVAPLPGTRRAFWRGGTGRFGDGCVGVDALHVAHFVGDWHGFADFGI